MRVLDLDLDFFLADCCPLAVPGERPVCAGHEPWAPESLRRFLEKQCGLDRCVPTPGRSFDTHDGALQLWDELIRSGALSVPFSVTHVDAHSDLGIGAPGPGFVLSRVLTTKPEKRPVLGRYYDCVQLDEANYLLFALAFRWVNELVNVRNPRSRPDIPREIAILNEKGEYQALLLRSPVSALMEQYNGMEPRVPFRIYEDYREYAAPAPFDFVSIARSPRYAPAEADALMVVVNEYIRPV